MTRNIRIPFRPVLWFVASLILPLIPSAGFGQDSSAVEARFYLDGSPVKIEIEGSTISRIVRLDAPSSPETAQTYVAPGFIDNQVNGYASHSFSTTELTVEQVRVATKGLWEAGVTTYLPTVTTNAHETIRHAFKVLAEATRDPEIGSSIPGFHLEGPYISPVDGYRGAHQARWVRPPDWVEFQEYYRAADAKILQVSLAPEIEGAMEFIRNCRKEGIVVALAHHNGSAAVITEAVDAGAAISTHLGNGCANEIHRHNNPLWPQLAEDRLMASIIVDSFHLRPEEVKTFFQAKGKDRIVVTSDVTKFLGLAPGVYNLDGKELELTPEGMVKFPAQNVLAGAALPVTAGVGNLMRYTGCSLADAVQTVTQNPARLYGWNDRGELAPGKRADLVVFRIENSKLVVQMTMVAGKVVYEAD
ncbi:MAG: amidohydrolase family protein [Acidobacteriota bacterium]|nr:MAG: amidohydrolase family protein [Acidobacteriota bacterium]